MTHHTGTVYTENEIELSWLIELSAVMTDSISAIYTENETKLLWSIIQGVVCDEN